MNHPDEQKRIAFSFFSFLWAFATLMHLLGNLQGLPTWPDLSWLMLIETILGLVALAILFKPSSWQLLLLLSSLQLLNLWQEAPRLGNHWFVTGMINSTILLAAIHLLYQKKSLSSTALWNEFSAPARLVWLIFYAFAAFNKWNSGFFNPAVSCAPIFYQDMLGWIGLGNQLWLYATPFLYLVIILAVLTETAVPILLSWKKSRSIGILVALTFHFILTLDASRHFYDFTGMLFPLFLLFMPLTFSLWVKEQLAAAAALRRWLKPLFFITLLFALFARLGYQNNWILAGVLFIGVQLLWLIFGAGILYLTSRFIWQQRPPPIPNPYKLPSPIFLLLPILLLLNGLSPHLGFKTGSAFNMYSNLRTEREPNHFLLANLPHLFNYQQDQITILSSSDPQLAQYGTNDYQLTYFEFQAYLAEHPKTAVSYERNGRTIDLPHAGTTPEFQQPLPTLIRKLIWFRPIDTQPAKRCLIKWGVAN